MTSRSAKSGRSRNSSREVSTLRDKQSTPSILDLIRTETKAQDAVGGMIGLAVVLFMLWAWG
jgi:hypothetical protein